MASYATWLGAGPEGAILHLLGLFDRPAPREALAALRAAPVMPGLSEGLFTLPPRRGWLSFRRASEPEPLSESEWQRAVIKLRHARLLAERDPSAPDTLDAHPLVREHFGEQLKARHPAAWQEAHRRLYAYYTAQARDLPDTMEEMAPLYAAVIHGCQAGRHQETLDAVYWKRILREGDYFSERKLGAFGADLAAVSQFFDLLWSRPAASLKERQQALLLNIAGFCLRALGRLREAVGPMQAVLQADITREDWKNAARAAGSLSELYLTLGDITQAQAYATQSVELADRSHDAFIRMATRTILADALHQAGRQAQAEAAFREAEAMQKGRSAYSLLGRHNQGAGEPGDRQSDGDSYGLSSARCRSAGAGGATQALLTAMWNVLQGFLSRDRHAPAWQRRPGWSPALPWGEHREDLTSARARAQACAMPTRTIYSAIWLL
jgi:tetratricopeptide (TPR) repeat protein